MASGIVGRCESCGAEFRSLVVRRFCSMNCYRVAQRSGAYKRGHGPDFPRAPCAHCGIEVPRIPSKCRGGAKSDKVFCDRGCYDAFRSGLRALRTTECVGCGRPFVRKANGQTTCSESCWKAVRKAKPKHCVNCGCWFTPVKLNRTAGRFVSCNAGKTCSEACRLAWISNNEERKRKIGAAFKGDRHPNWQGGKAQLNNISNRGPNWNRQRQRAIRRDGRCLDCGITDSECREKFGRGLDVDHVVPFHNFRSYRQANALSNLECRCASCHRIAESRRTMVQMVLPYQDSRKRMHKGCLRGEQVNTAKLTAGDVLKMRAAHKAGVSVSNLAKKYGVTIGAASSAISGKSWRHLPGV